MSQLHRLRAHTLIYLHSISNKVKPPRLSTQLQSHPWTILAQCSLDNCRPMAGSEATLRKTLGRGDRQPPCPSVIQQLSTPSTALYLTSLQTNTTALSKVPIMLQPIYTYNIMLQLMSRLYDPMLQPITSLHTKGTAYITSNNPRLQPTSYVLTTTPTIILTALLIATITIPTTIISQPY